jgi:protein dispatched 1
MLIRLLFSNAIHLSMALAMGSACVTALAVLVHTRSPFLTMIGLLQIILSFPLAYFTYALVAQLQFFPFLNFIGVFVVFALGAGDIFVAVDKWKNARLDHPKGTTEYIAALALPEAASAMFLTTITTAIAFFGTAICPVAPIKLFAIFCGLLIMFDYIMCVLLVFPALCIYDRKRETNPNCCITCHCCHRFEAGGNHGEEEDSKPSLIRRVLLGFYWFLHKFRWALFAVCAAGLGLSIYFATTLELPTSAEVRIVDESFEFEKNYAWRQQLLSTVLEKSGGAECNIIFGVKPADTGDQNNPESWSQLVLDKTFDPSSEESQEFLLEFCNKFFAEDFAMPVTGGFECSINRFDEWLSEQASLPPEEKDSVYTENCGGASGLPIPQQNFHACLTGWAQAEDEWYILSRDGVVTIMMIPFTARVRWDSPFDELDEEWNLIEDWMDDQISTAPKSVSKFYFSNVDFWWYDTNKSMLSTAYGAAGIALGAAAGVILFSSRSVTLTLYSVITIGYILTSVTASLVGLGWTLGFLESICFAILIGVSVDFVIHFSHSYSLWKGEHERGERTKHALIMMGPSILATAFTTFCAAIVMMFTIIIFFQKFALILFLTIVQATVGTFIFFLTMTDTIGPKHPTYLVDKLTAKFGIGEDEKGADKDESSRNNVVMGEGTAELSALQDASGEQK